MNFNICTCFLHPLEYFIQRECYIFNRGVVNYCGMIKENLNKMKKHVFYICTIFQQSILFGNLHCCE